MKTLKQYKYVLAATVIVAVLSVIRAFNPDIFRYDAVKWAEQSVAGGNIVTPEKISSTGKTILLVILDAEGKVPEIPGAIILKADPGELLAGDNIRKIRRNKGPVVLCSGDISVPARVWMVLSETGIRELYILKKDPV